MHRLGIALAALVMVVGCARGKMGQVDKTLEKGVISRTTPIYVEAFTTNGIVFTGDKADDTQRTNEEKATIAARYAGEVAARLRKRGFDAKSVSTPVKDGIVVSGNVRLFEHGSGSARFWVGMGAGASNMYTDVKIENRSKKAQISAFEIIATSGGRGGLSAMSSFMDAHIADGADKIAEYIEKSL